jgi:hypothetical protein
MATGSGSHDAPAIRFLPFSEVRAERAFDVIRAAFAPELVSWERFIWKHHRGPWGPAVGWVAEVGDDLVAVRPFVPWRFQLDGEELGGLRAMDGAVVPGARRHGLFSTLVRLEMERAASASSDRCLLMSTSVAASQRAYEKCGWGVVRFDHRLRVVRPRMVDVEEIDLDRVAGALDRTIAPGLRTAWTSDALAWRFDAASGHEYRCWVLPARSGAAGLVARVVRRAGLRVLVHCLSWGPPKDQAQLIRGAARIERAGMLLRLVPSRVLSRPGHATTVAFWSPDRVLMDRLKRPSSWSLDFADVEGVL